MLTHPLILSHPLPFSLSSQLIEFLRASPLWAAELDTVRKERLFREKRILEMERDKSRALSRAEHVLHQGAGKTMAMTIVGK